MCPVRQKMGAGDNTGHYRGFLVGAPALTIPPRLGPLHKFEVRGKSATKRR
jgi:hypothetical protein